MNREIKFRAWYKHSSGGGTMLLADEFNDKYNYYIKPSTGKLHVFYDHGKIPEIENEIILLQFTGLKDLKGVDIYEGDIVIKNEYPFYSDGLRNYVGIVEWFEEDLCWSYSMVVVSDRVHGCACGRGMNKDDEFEVIGNIYENPELLEKKL